MDPFLQAIVNKSATEHAEMPVRLWLGDVEVDGTIIHPRDYFLGVMDSEVGGDTLLVTSVADDFASTADAPDNPPRDLPHFVHLRDARIAGERLPFARLPLAAVTAYSFKPKPRGRVGSW